MISTLIKLVTVNVWFGMDGRGIIKLGDYETRQRKALRFSALVEGLKKMSPDVIAIQEANKLPAYARTLASELNYAAVWLVQNAGIKIMGMGIPLNFTAGNIILAKKEHKLRFIGAQRLSGKGILHNYFAIHVKEMRNAMAAEVHIGGHPLIIFNTHTHFSLLMEAKWHKTVDEMVAHGELSTVEGIKIKEELQRSYNRTEQDIMRLLHFIKKVTKNCCHPFVVMGDFNTTSESAALQHLVSELKLLDAFRIKNPHQNGFTWNPAINTNIAYDGSDFWADGKTPRDPLNRLEADFDREIPRRIDFVLLSSHFSPDMIKSAELIFASPVKDLFVSDHFGVQVGLKTLPLLKK